MGLTESMYGTSRKTRACCSKADSTSAGSITPLQIRRGSSEIQR